jgi:ABC-type taurine transport system substrate-binding protein
LEEKPPKVIKERPTRDKSRLRMLTNEPAGRGEFLGISEALEDQRRPGIDIRIDSKDFASMQPEQIQAFFDGLGRVMKETAEQKE